MNKAPSGSRRRWFMLATVMLALSLALPSTAFADSTWIPNPNNGQRVYLSTSCHNKSSQPSGPCNENFGCSGHMGENEWSRRTATSSLVNRGYGAGLMDRQYMVRIGYGTFQQNTSSSNAWGSTLHIPLHSNAVPPTQSTDCASPYTPQFWGTRGMYVSERGRQLASLLADASVGDVSPGTGDRTVYRSDLHELNVTNMPAAYLEAEFHTYWPGVTWLHNYDSWSWLIGVAVDFCRGYPRAGQGTTKPKHCTW